MHALPNKSKIRIGMKVFVELKQDQGSGKLTEGVVNKILTSSVNHPYGIMVELKDGKRGRVKTLSATHAAKPSKNISNVKDTSIPKIEDAQNEFKSTFQYDLNEEKLRQDGKIEMANARKNNYKKIVIVHVT